MNLPNQLTVARVVLIFIFVALANIGKNSLFSSTFVYWSHWLAFIVAIVAGVTDFFDGYLARKYNLITDFGKLMDPLADKIFITATFIMMASYGIIPAWVAVVVISREFLVTGLRLMATKKGEVISADRWGKLKTVLQMVMLIFAGAAWVGVFNLKGDVVLGLRIWYIWLFVLWGIVILTVLSGLGYFIRHRSLYLDSKL